MNKSQLKSYKKRLFCLKMATWVKIVVSVTNMAVVLILAVLFLPNSLLLGRKTVSITYAAEDTLATVAAIQSSGEYFGRGRVKIENNNVVADNGVPLRGEHMILAHGITNDSTLELIYDLGHWRELRDNYHLNTVRLMLSRPPQNWGGGPGQNCEPPIYRCFPLDYVHPNGKTTLQIIDDMVNIADVLGMYIIIDYHPVLGHDESDAVAWWTEVAPRYKERTHVIYEATNEPGNGDESYQKTMYQLIRSQAPDTHIILWSFAELGSNSKTVVDSVSGIDYSNVSVGFHPYWNYSSDDLETLRNAYPVIATEIGANQRERTDQMEDKNVSWIWLDGASNKPGVSGSDIFYPEDVYWAKDPWAIGHHNSFLPIVNKN